jgi:hypothetical protein
VGGEEMQHTLSFSGVVNFHAGRSLCGGIVWLYSWLYVFSFMEKNKK